MTLCEALRDAFVSGGTARRPRHDSGLRYFLANAGGVGVVMRKMGPSERQASPVRLEDLEAEDWQVVGMRQKGETLASMFGLKKDAEKRQCLADMLPTDPKKIRPLRISDLL